MTVFCEFVWVLRQGYKKPAAEVADAIRRLLRSASVVTNQLAVEAGLETLDRGGDFADGALHTKVAGWAPRSLSASTRRLCPCSNRKASASVFSRESMFLNR